MVAEISPAKQAFFQPAGSGESGKDRLKPHGREATGANWRVAFAAKGA